MLTENPYLRQAASTLFFLFCGLDNGVNLRVQEANGVVQEHGITETMPSVSKARPFSEARLFKLRMSADCWIQATKYCRTQSMGWKMLNMKFRFAFLQNSF
jgi:hypothetical protein